MNKKIYAGITIGIAVFVGWLNDAYNFMSGVVPTRIEFVVGNIGAVLGVIAFHLIGHYDDALESLLVLMAMDVVTGVSASIIGKSFLLNSQKGFRGMTKKFGVLVMVVAAYKFGQTLPNIDAEIIKDYVICAFCAVELLSITENLAKCGVPIPNAVTSLLEQLASQKAQRDELVMKSLEKKEGDKD